MGYMLPITPFNYIDYQNRVIERKQNFHYIEKPFKVFLDREQQSNEGQYVIDISSNEKKHTDNWPVNIFQPINIDKTYADITGKGSLFNEQI